MIRYRDLYEYEDSSRMNHGGFNLYQVEGLYTKINGQCINLFRLINGRCIYRVVTVADGYPKLAHAPRTAYEYKEAANQHPVIMTPYGREGQYYQVFASHKRFHRVDESTIKLLNQMKESNMNTQEETKRTKDEIITSQKDEIFDLMNQLREQKAEAKMAQEFVESKDARITELTCEIIELKMQMHELEDVCRIPDADVQTKLFDAAESMQKATAAMQTMTARIKHLESESESRRSMLHSAEQRNASQRQIIDEQINTIETLESQKGAMVDIQIVRGAQKQAKELEAAATNLMGDLSEQQAKYAELKSNATTHQISIAAMANLINKTT